jgi:hypothetical protein
MSITFKINTVDVGDYIIDAPEIPIIGRNRDYTMVATPIDGLVLRKNYPYQLEINQEVEILVDNVGWFYGYISGWNYNYDSLQYEVIINNMLDKILLDDKTKANAVELHRYFLKEKPDNELGKVTFDEVNNLAIWELPINETYLNTNDFIYFVTDRSMPNWSVSTQQNIRLGLVQGYYNNADWQYRVFDVGTSEVDGVRKQYLAIKDMEDNVLTFSDNADRSNILLGKCNRTNYAVFDTEDNKSSMGIWHLIKTLLMKYDINLDITNIADISINRGQEIPIRNMIEWYIDEFAIYSIGQEKAGNIGAFDSDQYRESHITIKDLFNLIMCSWGLSVKYKGNKKFELVIGENITNPARYDLTDDQKNGYSKNKTSRLSPDGFVFAKSKYKNERLSYYKATLTDLNTDNYEEIKKYLLINNVIDFTIYQTNSGSVIRYNQNLLSKDKGIDLQIPNNLFYLYQRTTIKSLDLFDIYYKIYDNLGSYEKEIITTPLTNELKIVNSVAITLETQSLIIEQEKII